MLHFYGSIYFCNNMNYEGSFAKVWNVMKYIAYKMRYEALKGS